MSGRKQRGSGAPRPIRKARAADPSESANSVATGPRRPCRSAADLPEIRGVLPVPKGILPWERELLLPIVLESLPDFVESKDHGKPNLDKKTK